MGTMVGVGAPVLPEVPVAPVAFADSPISVLALDVDLRQHLADRASLGVLGPAPAAVAADEEPKVFLSPVAPPRVAPWKLAAAGGAALVVIVLFAVFFWPKGRGHVASGRSDSVVGEDGTVDLDAHPARRLHVTADAPIAKVAVGDRTVDVAPASSVDVALLDAEIGKSLRVVVTSTDGRVATATADPGVRGLDVVLGDPSALPPPPSPPSAKAAATSSPAAQAQAAPKEKRTWPKRGPKK
jgi:hypothetical protein